MEQLWHLVSEAVSQCGIATGIAVIVAVYQTVQLGRLRGEVEQDRRQIVEDARARTRTAEAIAEAQQETVLRLIQRRSGVRAEG